MFNPFELGVLIAPTQRDIFTLGLLDSLQGMTGTTLHDNVVGRPPKNDTDSYTLGVGYEGCDPLLLIHQRGLQGFSNILNEIADPGQILRPISLVAALDVIKTPKIRADVINRILQLSLSGMVPRCLTIVNTEDEALTAQHISRIKENTPVQVLEDFLHLSPALGSLVAIHLLQNGGIRLK